MFDALNAYHQCAASASAHLVFALLVLHFVFFLTFFWSRSGLDSERGEDRSEVYSLVGYQIFCESFFVC